MNRLSVLVLVIAFSAVAAAQSPADPAPTIERAATVGVGGTIIPIAIGVPLFASGTESGQTIGLVLVGLGIVVGPSLSSYMLGDDRRTMIGLGVRAGALVALGGAFHYTFAASWDGGGGAVHLGNSVMMASAVLLGYGLAYNFIMLGDSARRVQLTPGVGSDPNTGALLPGLRIDF